VSDKRTAKDIVTTFQTACGVQLDAQQEDWLIDAIDGEMPNWRQISSAPKNFSPILGFMPGMKVGGQQEEFDEFAVIFWKGNGWRYQHDDHLWAEPTHWLPIPSNPT
jgi:hypothetical protein